MARSGQRTPGARGGRVAGRWVLSLLGCGLWGVGCTPLRPRSAAPLDLTLSAAAEARVEAQARYSRGLQLEWAGNAAGALAQFERALELDPEQDELYWRVAQGYLRQERVAEALTLTAGLCARRPRAPQPWLWRAQIQRRAGQPDAALASYAEAAARAPQESPIYLEWAALRFQQGRLGEALRVLDQGLAAGCPPHELLGSIAEIHGHRIAQAATPAERSERVAAALVAFTAAAAPPEAPVEALHWLALFQIEAGEYESALAVVERLPPADERRGPLRLRTVAALAVQGETERALAALDAWQAAEPEAVGPWLLRGEIHERTERAADARAAYEQALALEPGAVQARLRLTLLALPDEPAAAVRLLEAGLALEPENTQLLEALAHLRLEQGAAAEALERFEQLEALLAATPAGSSSPLYFIHRVLAAQLAGAPTQAATYLNELWAENPAWIEGYLQQAYQHPVSALRLEAAGLLEDLFAAEEPPPFFLRATAFLYLSGNEYAAAERLLRATEAAVEPLEADAAAALLDPFFQYGFGSVLERQGRYEEAEERFRRALELDPDFHEAQNYLAYMWAERGLNLEEGLELVERALVAEPDNPAYIDTRGWIYYMQGRYAEALADLERAVELLPDDPTILDHLGDALAQLERLPEARTAWQRALEFDPALEAVREKLAAHRELDPAPPEVVEAPAPEAANDAPASAAPPEGDLDAPPAAEPEAASADGAEP